MLTTKLRDRASAWRVLIVDNTSLRVVSSASGSAVNETLRTLDVARAPQPTLDGVYFLAPSVR